MMRFTRWLSGVCLCLPLLGMPAAMAQTPNPAERIAKARAELSAAEQREGARNPKLTNEIFALARALLATNDHRGAAEVLLKGRALTFPNNRDGAGWRAGIGLNAADALIVAGDLGAAEKLLATLRTEIEAAFGAEAPQVGQALYRLGQITRKQGRKEAAETLGRRAYALLSASVDPADKPEAMEAGISLAVTLYNHDRNAEAKDVAEGVLAIGAGLANPDPTSMAAMRKLLATIENETADVNARLIEARLKLAKAEAAFGPGDARLSPAIDALIDAIDQWASRMNRDSARDEALALIRRGAQLNWGESADHLALQNRFRLDESYWLLRLKRPAEALASAEALLPIVEKRFGTTSPQLGLVEHRIGSTLQDLDRDAEAAPHYERAAHLLAESQDTEALKARVMVGHNRASNLRDLDRKSEALAVAEEAQMLARGVEGLDKTLTLRLDTLVKTLRQSVLDRAQRLIRAKADLEAAEKVFKPDDPRLAALADALGDAYELTGDHANAAQHWRRAADLTPGEDEAAVEARHVLLVAAANALQAADRTEEAVPLLSRSLREIEVRFGATSAKAGELHNRIGVMLSRLGRDVEALTEFGTAMRLFDTDPAALDRQVTTRNNLSATLFEFGRFSEAADVAEEGLERASRLSKPDASVQRALQSRAERAKAAMAEKAAREAKPPDSQRLAAIARAEAALKEVEAANSPQSITLAAPIDALAEAQEQAGQWLQAAENRLRIAELGWDLHPQGAEAAAQAYNHAAYDFRQAGSMARAILASRAAARAALARGEHAPLYADMENRLGVVLSAAERKDEAIRHFERALNALAENSQPENRLRAVQYGFNLASTLSDLDRDAEGFDAARRAFALAEPLGAEATALRRSLAQLLHVTARVIANGHFEAGRDEAAIAPLRFAADLGERPGLVEPKDMFITLRKLDYAYHQTKRYAEAEKAGRGALAAALAASREPKRDVQVASAMENLANTLDALGRNGDGEDFAAQALAIRRTIDPESPQSLRSMVRLSAFLFDREGPTDKAIALARDAVARYEAIKATDRPEYLAALRHYALMMRRAARDGDVLEIDAKVLAASARIAGRDSLAHGNTLIGASYTLVNLGRTREAAAMRREGLALVRRFSGPDTDALINALIATADLWEKDRSALLWEAFDLAEKATSDPKGRISEIVRHLASSMINAGKPEEALGLIERAEGHLARRPKTQRQRLDDEMTRLALLGARVDAAVAMKDYAGVEKLGSERLELARRLLGPNAPLTLEFESIQTVALEGQKRFVEFEAAHRKVLTARQAALPQDHVDIASSQHNLAFALLRLNRAKEALPLERAAIATTRKGENPERLNLSRLLRTQARIEARLNQHPAALKSASEATRRVIEATKADTDRLGQARARRLAEARDVFATDVEISWGASRQARQKGSPARLSPPPIPGSDGAAIEVPPAEVPPAATARPKRAPAKSGLPSPAVLMDRAFLSAQWAMSTAAATALARTSARFAAGDGAMAQTIRARQDIVEDISALERRLGQALAAEAAEERKRALELRQTIEARKVTLDRIDQEIAQRFPRFAALANPVPANLAEARKALRPGEAIVQILTMEEAGYVWVVTPKAARWQRVPVPRAELEELVQRLRANLGAAPAARGAENLYGEAVSSGGRAFDRAAAHALYKAYLAPFRDLLPKDTTLYFALSGAWTSLPPGLLVTEAPSGNDSDPDTLRDTRWLLRDHAVAILPSVSSLIALRRIAPREGDMSSAAFAGFGAPELAGGAPSGGAVEQISRGGLADVREVRQLASLPQTEAELRNLAAALGAPADSVVLGAEATEARVRNARLSQVRVLAFATHGLVAGEISGLAEPALVFTPPPVASEEDDGLLTASEAAGLELSADWVILSACNTASGDGKPGAEALSGLARSFFYAGAKSLLVSHWPVDDSAAARLTSATLSRTSGPNRIGRAEALRRAMLDLMKDRQNPHMAHPVMWAPFVVVGEGH